MGRAQGLLCSFWSSSPLEATRDTQNGSLLASRHTEGGFNPVGLWNLGESWEFRIRRLGFLFKLGGTSQVSWSVFLHWGKSKMTLTTSFTSKNCKHQIKWCFWKHLECFTEQNKCVCNSNHGALPSSARPRIGLSLTECSFASSISCCLPSETREHEQDGYRPPIVPEVKISTMDRYSSVTWSLY